MLIKSKVQKEEDVELEVKPPLFYRLTEYETLHCYAAIMEDRTIVYVKPELIVRYKNASDREIAGIVSKWTASTQTEFMKAYVAQCEEFDTALKIISL
jgi:hypothetical protein